MLISLLMLSVGMIIVPAAMIGVRLMLWIMDSRDRRRNLYEYNKEIILGEEPIDVRNNPMRFDKIQEGYSVTFYSSDHKDIIAIVELKQVKR